MKIAIIQFSPSGYTRKVTSMLERELTMRNQKIQILDVTGDEDFFIRKDIHTFLSKNIKPHDILLIGSPIYAHHFFGVGAKRYHLSA